MRRLQFGDILGKKFAPLWVLLLLIILYGAINPLRVEHWGFLGLFVALVLVSRPTRELAVAVWPAAIFGFAYDIMRLLLNRAYDMAPSEWVHGLEQALLGWMTPAAGDLGPVDFFATHHCLPVDLLGGLWYSTHVPSVVVFGLYLWWRTFRQREESARRLDKYFWGFLLFNLFGMTIWAFWPVAPPWYVEVNGFAPPQTLDFPHGLLGSPAGLARVDSWLGFPQFADIYRHSTYVFGAMPSLHAAAPIWVALWARKKLLRLLAWIYALAMCFFAVYLTHHYVVDVLAGALLSTTVYLVLTRTVAGDFFVGLNDRLRAWLDVLVGAPASPVSAELNSTACSAEPELSEGQEFHGPRGSES